MRVLEASSGLTATARALMKAEAMAELTPGSQLEALLGASRALKEAGVRVALIGGLAVGVRAAVPRATMDVDLAAASTVDRAAVVDALVEAGFEHHGSYPHSENFRHTGGEPVQVAFDPAMDEAILRAEPLAVGDHQLRVVRTDDLIAMKRRSGNDPRRRRSKALRDLADVELLLEAGSEPDEGW